MHIPLYILRLACTHTTYACINACTCTCMHACTYTLYMYALTHTHAHTHINTHTHTKKLILQAMNKGPTSPEVHKTDALCVHVFPWLVVRPPRSRGPLPGFKLLFGSVMGTDFPLEVVEREQCWIFIFSYTGWTRINQPATNLKEPAPQFHWRNYFLMNFRFSLASVWDEKVCFVVCVFCCCQVSHYFLQHYFCNQPADFTTND